METGKSTSEKKSDLIVPLFYEFCGSALMVYAYNLTDKNFSVRAFALFIGYMIASKISGAHFNPATSLAVYVVEQKYKENILYLGLVSLAQFLGGLAGLLFVYLLMKTSGFYTLYPGNGPFSPKDDFYIYKETVFYGRVCFQEILQTFTFTLVLLIIKYEKSLSKVNNVIKGLAITHAQAAVYLMTYNSGACLNPVLGIVQTFYMMGQSGNPDRYWNCIWVYVLMPIIGAYVASLFYGFHQTVSQQNGDKAGKDEDEDEQ